MICFIWADEVDLVKIGYSSNPWSRIAQLQTSTPFSLRLGVTAPGTRITESRLHQRFRVHHIRREWFRSHVDIRWTQFAILPTRGSGRSVDDLLDVTEPWAGSPSPRQEWLGPDGSVMATPQVFVAAYRSVCDLFATGHR